MATTAVDLLRVELQEAYDRLRALVDRLTDEEFFWQPVPDCWTVRKDDRGHWGVDYPADAHPVPAPFTTIAWRLVHVSECKVMYREYAFGAAKLTWPDIDSAHTAADAIAQLEYGQRLLVEDLAGLHDANLDEPRLTNWGQRWPAWRVFWTMIDHDAVHGGEIGALRDLYRLRSGRSQAG